MGRLLKEHTAERALRHRVGRAMLNEIRLEPMLRKFVRAERPGKVATRIPRWGWLDQPCIWKDCLNKLHCILRGEFARHPLRMNSTRLRNSAERCAPGSPD